MTPRRARARKGFWCWILLVAQWGALAVGGLIVAALLSLQLRVVRNFARLEVNDILRSTFAGRVVIERIDRLSLTGIGGARVRVEDSSGTQVLLVDDISVSVATSATLGSWLRKEGDLVVDITRVQLGYVDASVDTGGDGKLRLLQAFAPKENRPDSAPASRATVIHLRQIMLRHGWVHGQPQDAPPVDADLDRLDLSLIVGGERTVADLAGMDLTARALPRGIDLHTHLEAHFAKPGPNGSDQAGRVDGKGDAAGIPFSLDASLDGPDVAGHFDVPKMTPAGARGLDAGLTLTQDLTAHAELRGRLPAVDARVHVGAGKGALDIDARAAIAEEKKVHATLRLRGLDAHALVQTAPATRLDTDATFDVLVQANGNAQGAFVLDVPSGDAGGNLVPATHVAGQMAKVGASDGAATLAMTAEGDLDEPGAPTKVRVRLEQRGSASTVAFQVNTVAGKLNRTRFGNVVSGAATMDARGIVTLGRTTTVDAAFDLRTSAVAAGDARIDRAALHARVQGDVTDPTGAAVNVDLKGSGVVAAGMRFATASVTMRGTPQAAKVTASLVPADGPRIDGSTWVALEDGLALRNTRLDVARDDVTARLRVATMRIGAGKVRVEDVSLEGVGEPLRADVKKTDREIIVRAATDGLDLAKVGRLLRRRDLSGGRLALDVDVTLHPAAATGHVRAHLENGTFARVRNGAAQVEAKFSGRRVEATAHANLGDIGKIDVDDCDVEIEGSAPWGMAAVEKARGRLALDAQINIARLKALLPRGSVPFTDMQGALHVKGEIARSSVEEAPAFRLSLATRGLLLSGRGDPEEREQVDGTRVDPTPPWSLEGVDVEIAGKVAKDSGATTFQGRVFDRKGTVVSVDARSTSMPYRHWLRAKAIDPSALSDLRWTADVAVPRRDFQKFPALLKTQQMSGSLDASFHFDGSLAKPDLRLLVDVSQWATPVPRGMQPLNAKVDAHYQQNQGAVDITVASKEKQLLTGTVEMRGSLPGLPYSRDQAVSPWRASTKMRIAEFPLETLGAFSNLQMKGFVSGDIAVDDVHADARGKAELALRDVQLGRVRFPQGHAKADFDGRSLRGALRLDQTDGFVEGEAQVAMRWGANMAPAIVTAEPAFATLKANRFRAAAILPFATGALGELDGRINADARIDVVPGGPPKLRGNVTLERGRVQLARLGEPMHDVNARIALTPDGLVRLEDLTAQGSTGRLEAKGVVRLNGFQLVGARATLKIPKNDPFPLDIDGQAVGEIDAEVNLSADMTPDQRTMNVKVDIPRLHTQLPLAASNKPQELGESEKIHVGYFRRPRQFVILPKDAEDLEDHSAPQSEKTSTAINVAIHLGDDVEVRRGTTIRIALTGDPKIELDDKPKMSGQIRLTRGMLEVQGRRFQIEKGVVTFVGDPSNPQVIVTAAWDAPDGTRVYADFTGPLKTGTVKLRSEPARPQNEILALIMFGSAEGSSSTPYPTQQPDGAVRAGTMAGGLATEGLSKGLDQLTGLDVSAKIDTTNAANPKPEVEVQIARDISVQVAYVIGQPGPGMNPDRTFVTLDWRFRRNWSMESTFGDAGTSILDLLWQYRY